MSGQINRGSLFGERLFKLATDRSFHSFVEIGTWNGEGSTQCLMDGLLSRNDDSHLTSLESDLSMHEAAKAYWSSRLPLDQAPRLKLIHGRLVEEAELLSAEDIQSDHKFRQHPWLEWRDKDIADYVKCDRVDGLLPEVIDVLLLDGGEFSTYAEFRRLSPRTKVVALDDTAAFKTERIRKELLADSAWVTLCDLPRERNGIYIGRRRENQELVR